MLLLVLLRLLLVDCCSKKLSSFYWYCHCAVANTPTLADAVAITSHLVYFLLFQQFATVGAVTASFAEPTPPQSCWSGSFATDSKFAPNAIVALGVDCCCPSGMTF